MFSVCLTPQPPPDPLGFILSTTTNQITSIMVSDSEQTPVAHMQRFAIGPFLSFLVFEGIWSIRITPSRHQPTSTPLDPSSPIIFISFLRPLSYRVLAILYLSTFGRPVFLRYLSSSLVLRNAYWFVIQSHFLLFVFISRALSTSFPSLFSLFTLDAFCCMCIHFSGPFLKFPKLRAFTLFCHRDYIPP